MTPLSFRPRCEQGKIPFRDRTHTEAGRRNSVGGPDSGKTPWLHLSDIHFQAGDGYSLSRVMEALLVDVSDQIQLGGFAPDLIFFTGDVAFSGRTDEYLHAEIFLDRLLEIAHLPRNRLFVIPGNHDIDRRALDGLTRPLVRKNSTREDLSQLLFGEHKSNSLAGLKEYHSFVTRYWRSTDPETFIPFYSRRIDLPGLSVGILGLNSAFGCFGQRDRNYVLVTERQVVDALAGVGNVDLMIALIHYPFDWINDLDRRDIEPLLMDSCDFVLHGHVHRQGVLTLASPDSIGMVISAGSLYQGRSQPNCYNIVRLGAC